MADDYLTENKGQTLFPKNVPVNIDAHGRERHEYFTGLGLNDRRPFGVKNTRRTAEIHNTVTQKNHLDLYRKRLLL